MFNSEFKNKKILITGHTGFKGCWLTIWMNLLGAKVVGISDKKSVSEPSMFVKTKIFKKIKNYYFDIKNYKKLSEIIHFEKPDFIFHLAAQSLVLKSYKYPIETLRTNIWGTLNLLECLKHYKNKLNVIFITSDKCYKNFETDKGYSESDHLGGDDLYSASKASAEIIINAYFKSFLKNNNKISIATVRAGNVIGGGDWSENRLIPDIMSNYFNKKPIFIRNPYATRPWQHVLEPISGYIHLANSLNKNRKLLNGESFNFGPNTTNIINVYKLLGIIKSHTQNLKFKILKNSKFHENTLLQLDSSKSKKLIKWKSAMSIKESISFTYNWYENYFINKNNNLKFTEEQIFKYYQICRLKKIAWSNDKKN